MLYYKKPLLNYVYRSESNTDELINFIAPRQFDDEVVEQAIHAIEHMPEYKELGRLK